MDDFENTKQIVMQRYEIMPTEIRDLFDLGLIEQTSKIISETYALTEEQKIELENQIVMVLLLFLPREGFSSRVAESLFIDQSAADMISGYVHTELFDLIGELLEVTDEKFHEISTIETNGSNELPKTSGQFENSTSSIQKSAESLSETQSQTVSAREQIPPLRTMQGDAERIHGYGAYRSRMKEKYGTPAPKPADNKNLADLPQYKDE